MNIVFVEFTSIAEMVTALSKETAQKLADAVEQKGVASYVAAGGTTVPPLFHDLSCKNIPWDKVQITLSDELWVEPKCANSNQNLIARTLLQNNAAKASLTPLWYDCETPEMAASMASEALERLSRPFDVTLLGMGADMHAASLFPDANGIVSALDVTRDNLACAIGPIQTVAGVETRLSLSLRAILASKIVYIMIVGEKKRAALELAISLNDPIKSPVSAILKQEKCPVHIYWAP